MKQPFSICYVALIFTLLCQEATAQRRFSAAAEVGFTASQLDGDLSAGFNKLGLMAGIKGIVNLKSKTHLSLGFNFAQRGAQDELVQSDINTYAITTNYVEIPVMLHYADWLQDKDDEPYYKVFISGGLSYGRLISTKLRDDGNFARVVVSPSNPPPGKDNYLNDQDLSLTAGASLFFQRNLGFNVRYMRSVTFLYNPKKWDPSPLQRGWNAHSLTFSLTYRIL
jgi:hypothetical protein